jgi:hypothetical protein
MKVERVFVNKCQWSQPGLAPFGVMRRAGAPAPRCRTRVRSFRRVVAFANQNAAINVLPFEGSL